MKLYRIEVHRVPSDLPRNLESFMASLFKTLSPLISLFPRLNSQHIRHVFDCQILKITINKYLYQESLMLLIWIVSLTMKREHSVRRNVFFLPENQCQLHPRNILWKVCSSFQIFPSLIFAYFLSFFRASFFPCFLASCIPSFLSSFLYLTPCLFITYRCITLKKQIEMEGYARSRQ